MTTDSHLVADTSTPPGESRSGRIAMAIIVALAIGFSALQIGEESGASSLGFLNLVLLGLLAGGLVARRFGLFSLPRWIDNDKAPYVYVLFVWVVSMLYELSLRTGETGFGGLHPNTVASFTMAQGFYIPFALCVLWVIRRRWLSLPAVFWLGASASWYELMTVGLPGIFATPGNFILAPLVLGYYLAIYGMFAALPLVFVDVEALWGDTDRPYTLGTLVGHGILIAVFCWGIYALWSLALSRLLGW